jgi:cell division protein FtsW
MALIGITIALIIKQPNLSMTIILSLVTFGTMFISGIPTWLLTIIGAGGGYGVVHKISHTAYQMRRIQGWLDPWKDSQDTGYNLIQSLYAIGSGGLVGTGLGMSHQKLYYLPFQYTDFIFAVWAEEWGLIGCVILIGLFAVLLYRGFVIAQTCRSPFGQVLAMGITMMFASQIIINMAVATGLFPVTGVTLPFISYGGTSVLVTSMMIGMLLNISRYRITVTEIGTHAAS